MLSSVNFDAIWTQGFEAVEVKTVVSYLLVGVFDALNAGSVRALHIVKIILI